ncbi:uncharacterized protein ACBT44_012798 isoform 1-T1 [Syngnathus typhle]
MRPPLSQDARRLLPLQQSAAMPHEEGCLIKNLIMAESETWATNPPHVLNIVGVLISLPLSLYKMVFWKFRGELKANPPEAICHKPAFHSTMTSKCARLELGARSQL